jgi:hypothetical protein
MRLWGYFAGKAHGIGLVDEPQADLCLAVETKTLFSWGMNLFLRTTSRIREIP